MSIETLPADLQPIELDDATETYTLEEFVECLRTGQLNSDDGSGYYACAAGWSQQHPAFWLDRIQAFPAWADSVVWFSK